MNTSIRHRIENILAAAARTVEEEEAERQYWVTFFYRQFLRREPDAGGLAAYVKRLQDGCTLSQIAEEISSSEEANSRRFHLDSLNHLTDSDFVLTMAELLRPGFTAKEIEYWRQFIKGAPARRTDFLQHVIGAAIERRQEETIPNTSGKCWIMGTDSFLTLQDWNEKAEALGPHGAPSSSAMRPQMPPFQHSGTYLVSAIASLYKGGEYIDAFLENITSQTIFDRSELIIIDADSPEGEAEKIKAYQQIYPNIIYKRMDYRIGVYDAWNVGISLARGKYLTNTNVDDLRRHDSFELQANALEANPLVDVIYQDFFYSLNSSFGFDDVAILGFKSDLPSVTPTSLLAYNSPHNAPMWRRTLHDELGLFDTWFESAGDYEFWMRCVTHGKQFTKIDTPHVVYFQNPKGISTRPNNRGHEESRVIKARYYRTILEPHAS